MAAIPYEKDIVAWANEQARLLRAGLFSQLDIEHIAEEIEDVGKSEQRELVKRQIDVKLPFLDFASKHNLSALHGTGVGKLLEQVDRIYRSAGQTVTPNRLTDIMQRAQDTHQPPMVRGRRIRLKYAHQGGHNPPTIIIHGNQTESVPPSYKRYLIAAFRKALEIEGSPIKLEFKTGDNPYKDKKNELNPRQIAKRKRMMKHVKK